MFEGPNVGSFRSLRDVQPAKMVDDDNRRNGLKKRHEFLENVSFEVDDDVPAQGFDLAGVLSMELFGMAAGSLLLGNLTDRLVRPLQKLICAKGGIHRWESRR